MKNFLLPIIFCLSHFLSAQNHSCGTELIPGEDHEALQEKLKSQKSYKGPLTEFPLSIFIIGSNEEERTNLYFDILKQIENTNKVFEPTGFKFVSCQPYFIGGSSSIDTGGNGKFIADNNDIPGTINIYFANDVYFYSNNGTKNSLCGRSAFPWYETRRIFMRNNCLTGGTFEHEIGHYFGLFYKHETYFNLERANGSNCTTAGDLLCDTPADPRLSFANVSVGCQYNGNEIDLFGYPYSPDPTNYMSYSTNQCRTKFSNQQLSKMRSYMIDDSSSITQICGELDLLIGFEDNLELDFGKTQEIEILIINENLEESIQTQVAVSLDNNVKRVELIDLIELTIAPGEELVLPVTIELADNYPSGDYFVSFMIDPDFNIIERNKYNNRYSVELKSSHTNKSSSSFYPNPASHQITAFFRKFVYAIDKPIEVVIFDQMGQRVYSEERYGVSGPEIFYTLDISNLTQGVYFVHFYWANDKSDVLKFVKVE